jgi:hypothetical protein
MFAQPHVHRFCGILQGAPALQCVHTSQYAFHPACPCLLCAAFAGVLGLSRTWTAMQLCPFCEGMLGVMPSLIL